MELHIAEQNENPLLNREEFTVEIEHTGESTPSKNKIRKLFAAENDLDPEKLEVKRVYTGFGNNTSQAQIKAYEEKVIDLQEEAEEEPEPEEETADEAETGEEPAEDSKAEEEKEETDDEETEVEEEPDEPEDESEEDDADEAEEEKEDDN